MPTMSQGRELPGWKLKQELYRDNGEENGNYRDYIGVI